MTKNTHVAVGSAVSMAVIQPDSFTSLAICLAAATIGSVIPDIDVKSSKPRQELNKIIIISVIAIALCTLLEVLFHVGIYSMLQNQTSLTRSIAGLGFFLFVCCYGTTTPHRSFMHSALGVLALTGIMWVIFPAATLPFLTGMLSHIFLDFFNKKAVRIMYPLKKPKVKFNLCSADGTANKFIGTIATVLFVLEIIAFLAITVLNW